MFLDVGTDRLLMKCLSSRTSPPQVDEVVKGVVYDLLDQLAKKDEPPPPPEPSKEDSTPSEETPKAETNPVEDFASAFSIRPSVNLRQELVRNSSSSALLQHEVEDNQVTII